MPLLPKFKIELYNYHEKVLTQGAGRQSAIKAIMQRAARNTVCNAIILYEYRGFSEGYVIIAEGKKEDMLAKYC